MRSPDLRIGSLPPVRVSLGTVLTVVVIAVIVHPAIAADGAGAGRALVLAILVGLVVIVSVLLHELAHALTATAFGASVDHIALTLWGGHTQYRGREVGPWASILISLAGPATNALVGLVAMLALPLAPGWEASVLLSYTVTLSLALAVFNLLPGLPMDGGRALEGLIGALTGRPRIGTVVTAWIGRGIAALVLVVPVVRLLRSPGSLDVILLLWALVIAGILWRGAGAAMAGARTESRMERLDARELVRPVILLSPDATAADLPVGAEPGSMLVLDASGGGHRLDADALAAVPAAARPRTPITALTTGIGPVGRLPAAEGGRDLVARMMRERCALYLVLDAQGRPVGTVSAAEVGARLR